MATGPPVPQQTTVVVPGQGWVDVASRVVVQVGFPVVVAGVLLWFLLTRFQENMTAIVTRMSNNTTVVATLIEEEKNSLAELQRQTDHMAKQTDYMAKVVGQAQQLVDLHQQELAELKAISGKKHAD